MMESYETSAIAEGMEKAFRSEQKSSWKPATLVFMEQFRAIRKAKSPGNSK